MGQPATLSAGGRACWATGVAMATVLCPVRWAVFLKN